MMQKTSQKRLSVWLNEDVDCRHSYILLLILSLGAGALDSMAITTLHVFIANMTGNVILLALAASNLKYQYPDLVQPTRCVVALSCFCIGAFVAGRVQKGHSTKHRGILLAFSFTEALLCYVSAILLYAHAVDLSNYSDLAIIAVLSLVMGSQQVWTRTLDCPSITVTVLTNATCQLFADPKLFALHNKGRNQKAAFICIFFLGAITGGLTLRYVNAALPLIMTATFKILGAFTLVLYPGQQPKTVKDGSQIDFKNVANS